MPTNPALTQPALYSREFAKPINMADYVAPIPNGGQALTVSAAGVAALTIPTDTIAAVITNPAVAIRIAYGVTASATVGTNYNADSNPAITSAELLAAASVYFTAACTGAYVQYYK